MQVKKTGGKRKFIFYSSDWLKFYKAGSLRRKVSAIRNEASIVGRIYPFFVR